MTPPKQSIKMQSLSQEPAEQWQTNAGKHQMV